MHRCLMFDVCVSPTASCAIIQRHHAVRSHSYRACHGEQAVAGETRSRRYVMLLANLASLLGLGQVLDKMTRVKKCVYTSDCFGRYRVNENA